jgi:hypothetical protein
MRPAKITCGFSPAYLNSVSKVSRKMRISCAQWSRPPVSPRRAARRACPPQVLLRCVCACIESSCYTIW